MKELKMKKLKIIYVWQNSRSKKQMKRYKCSFKSKIKIVH